MDSISDALKLTLKDNDELKAALGGAKPGDKLELCVSVTVRSNDEDTFDALIDEVELMEDEAADEEAAPAEDKPEDMMDDEDEKPSAALIVMASKKKKKEDVAE